MRKIVITTIAAMLSCMLLLSCSQEPEGSGLDLGALPPLGAPTPSYEIFEGTYEVLSINAFLPEEHLYSFSEGVITAVPYHVGYPIDEPVRVGSYLKNGSEISITFNALTKNGTVSAVEEVGIDLSLAGGLNISLQKLSDDFINTEVYTRGKIDGMWIQNSSTFGVFYNNHQCQILNEQGIPTLDLIYSFNGTGKNILQMTNYESFDTSSNFALVGEYLVIGNTWMPKIS